MTVFEKVWGGPNGRGSWNNVPTAQTTALEQSQSMLYALKDWLVSLGWTVDCSSDSVSASGPSGGTDYWSSGANLVWAASGTAHSWIWLRSPNNFPTTGRNYWLLIDCNNASNHFATFSFASGVPTGSVGAGAGNFNIQYSGTATNANAFAAQQFRHTSLVASKYHMLGTTDGDFIFTTSEDLSGYYQFGLALLKTRDFKTADLWPAIEMCRYYRSTVNAAAPGVWNNIAFNVAAGIICAQGHHATTGAAGARCSLAVMLNGSGGAVSANYAYNDIDGLEVDVPLTIWSTVSPSRDFRGFLPDIREASSIGASASPQAIIGDVEPTSPPGTIFSTKVGSFWFPCDVVPSL